MPETWTHRRVRLPWGRLSVYTAGDGPPLLLLHGLGGSGRYWAGMAAIVEGRSLIAPDLPGFGRSDKPDVDYSRDFHVTALDGLLRGLGAADAVDVAGHSMGGILAGLFAARHPGRVKSLAVVASPFPRQQVHPYRMPRGALGATAYRTMQTLVPLVSPVVRSATFPQAVIADYLRHTLDSYQRTSNALIWDPTVAVELSTLRDALRGRPQLLLYSDEDRTIGADNLQRWRAALPEAEVIVIAGAHQLLLRDHFATLVRWYAEQPAQGRART